MTQSFDLAQAYVTALTGDPHTIMDFRCIHDTNKAIPAHNHRGTLQQVWPTLVDYNARCYGIFTTVNAMDGTGHALENVQFIRAHCVDIDNLLTAEDSYKRAVAAAPQPHFAVQSSPGKYHIYWLVEPYVSNEYFTLIQRKLRQVYDGDKSVIDAPRVLRVPGFYHLKAEPFLITCWGIHGGPRWAVQQIAETLENVNVIDHVGMRSPLGDPQMKAPSLEWLRFALHLLNPNELDRSEWMSISAAFKQAGWSLADENTLLSIWNEWCAQYEKNDVGENFKLWHSFRETEVGWAAFERRTAIKGHMMHYGLQNAPAVTQGVAQPREPVAGGGDSVGAVPTHPTSTVTQKELDDLPELLSGAQCKKWFHECYFVSRTGEIFGPRGRYMNSTQFNGLYGGKHFIITGGGKATDEPWKAALRSTVYTIPKVDHVRFLPDQPPFAMIKDRMGRNGLNTYIPIKYDAVQGDVSLWTQHVEKILPAQKDREIFYSYLAHCIKYPGHKIPWAFLLQSAEGIGKTVFYEVMKHALGDMYVYTPKAQELVSSGSKFNAWMRGKLLIVVNEINVDERRDLIEILKPMITDTPVEVQAKGVDQEMEDNPGNWLMFSNFKGAVPISKNGRRYCISFSALQSLQDILAAGMDDAYFNKLWYWLKKGGGFQAVTHWLLHYPVGCIDDGGLPVRAPHTSSYEEALRISRSPMQIIIEEAIEDGLPGFIGGYISSAAVLNRVAAIGVKTPGTSSIKTLLETMGYHELGRGKKCYLTESLTNRSVIFANRPELSLDGYARAQGYEP